MFKVLVVDDDPTILIFIRKLLTKKFNCRVVTAENGLEGLTKVKEENPEVIFLDVTMPVMSGLEMLNALKDDPLFNKIPVIMLTAVKDVNLIREVTSKGVLAYILKPLMLEPTTEKIKEIFYKIRDEQEEDVKARVEEENSKLHSDRVLIVDTDVMFKASLKEQMDQSHEIFQADNGADALDIFIKQRPKLVCIGDKLPLYNERLLAQKLRSLQRDEKITIYLLHGDSEITEEVKELFDLIIPRTGLSDLTTPL